MLKKKKQTKSSVLEKQSTTALAKYKQWLQDAFQNQLFLCAYLHVKRKFFVYTVQLQLPKMLYRRA